MDFVSSTASGTWSFLRRKWKPLLAAGVLAGGVAYAIQSLSEHEEEEEQRDELATELMKTHYSETRNTADATVVGTIGDVKAVIDRLSSVEDIVAGLRQKVGQSEKKELWAQLKVHGVAQTVAAVYGVAALTVLTRVQINILGRHMYLQSVVGGSNNGGRDVRVEYLAVVEHFITTGFPLLVGEIMTVVEGVVAPIKLKEQVSIEDLRSVIKAISQQVQAVCFDTHSKFSAWFLPVEKPSDERLLLLLRELEERLDSPEATKVLGSCLDEMFDVLLVHALSCFKRGPSSKKTCPCYDACTPQNCSIRQPTASDDPNEAPSPTPWAMLVMRFAKLYELPLSSDKKNTYLSAIGPALDPFCLMIYGDFDRTALHEVSST